MAATSADFPDWNHGRVEFETLISDTSARLVAAGPADVDAAIVSALREVMQFFRADRCSFLSVAADARTVHNTHAAHADGVPEVPADINLAEHFPWVAARVIDERTPFVAVRLADLPAAADLDRLHFQELASRSVLVVPIVIGAEVSHIIVLDSITAEREWSSEYVPRLRVLGEMMANARHRANRATALEAAHEEVKRLRDRLERENVYLRKEAEQHSTGLVSGRSPALRRALTLAQQVAPTTSTVLLTGETGTGKERFAAYVHENSPRRARHMVRVNCSAIPSTLIESELFGREKGAYTGALSRQVGRFELAHGSTLFLDEIGDLPPEVQVKLLRVLQERVIERLGSATPISVDVRIIAATNLDLESAVREGSFRSDLFYRLNVFPIVVPPLRERREDLPALVEELVRELGEVMRKRVDAVDRASLDALAAYDWPGNVRELRNVLERAMILAAGPILSVEPPITRPVDHTRVSVRPSHRDLRVVEREHILQVLESTGWRIRGQHAAAAILGLKATTLEARMAKLGIRRPGADRSE